MTRSLAYRLGTTAALGLSLLACHTAHADQIGPQPLARQVAEMPARRPVPVAAYGLQILAENGRELPTYHVGSRAYLLGENGTRYIIRITNPTARRVEAVISVDGLDVIDGKGADLSKRGYIVPAYGELRVEGFRTSTSEIAAFRFSSVSNSYAGRKGQARNVGVVGLAIFEEKAAPQIITEQQQWRERDYDYNLDDDIYWEEPSYDKRPYGGRGDIAPNQPTAKPTGKSAGSGGGGLASKRAPSPVADEASAEPAPTRSRPAPPNDPYCCTKPKKEDRPGLGTEFGERRYSAVSWTKFERANLTQPSSIAELRYNDAAGLQALGIRIAPAIDPNELATRETANPFPGERFATPPR